MSDDKQLPQEEMVTVPMSAIREFKMLQQAYVESQKLLVQLVDKNAYLLALLQEITPWDPTEQDQNFPEDAVPCKWCERMQYPDKQESFDKEEFHEPFCTWMAVKKVLNAEVPLQVEDSTPETEPQGVD